MSTFITRLDATGAGPRVAVKDIIDVEGVPTTAGCRAIERTATAAGRDAACLAGLRAADARIVGKANLHELAMLPLGTNPWFGTPVNPFDAERIPGGSSSCSAVAVATGEADIALGSDTGGSVRVPSAFCGTAGLKTTHGRIPLDGVYPLAPSLDTIGPMAASIAGLTLGMQLLEPGFQPAATAAGVVGRVRTNGHPDIEAAIDAALCAAELETVDIPWDAFEIGSQCFVPIYAQEVWEVDHALLAEHPDAVGADCAGMMQVAEMFRPGVADARAACAQWRCTLAELFSRVELLALPTVPVFAPRLDELDPDDLLPAVIEITSLVAPFNPSGSPAARGSMPASLQLVGPQNGEELLVRTAQRVEDATRD